MARAAFPQLYRHWVAAYHVLNVQVQVKLEQGKELLLRNLNVKLKVP
jgi:hypothetical protein